MNNTFKRAADSLAMTAEDNVAKAVVNAMAKRTRRPTLIDEHSISLGMTIWFTADNFSSHIVSKTR